MSFTLERFTGRDIMAVTAQLAALRVAVFREFPYLYEGTPEYEARYVQPYLTSPHSLAVIVRHGDKVIGASTALPLVDEAAEVQRPFLEQGYDPDTVFYLAESVLLPAYRGRGLGVRFFEERERHARTLGSFRFTTFCAVDRPADHPRRPRSYTPLDEFWRKRGYVPKPELATHFSWRDLGETGETAKPMTFWLKELESS
ncbi:GNAT family N-acetyltransferase [Deinococcus peraridilitoris]|uniref:Acetyltransferase (GNAT) family protein n=1 Tax=Deinococcus peraridilitoris (strain DSM 19664 / LMG 22246 / CIP 109416 / KR-200) TaxID=937777 RepID=K9ZYT2_DEIPD|nr:GNAT family N-acetyltransferase [Deinococcus peraridilitoris]AFZ66741.1 acetyltransferase (GNAT) family protein [Deinococcus peraridilitoris DSM 19664]